MKGKVTVPTFAREPPEPLYTLPIGSVSLGKGIKFMLG